MEYSRPRKDNAEIERIQRRLSGGLPGSTGSGEPDEVRDARQAADKDDTVQQQQPPSSTLTPEQEAIAAANRQSRKALSDKAQSDEREAKAKADYDKAASQVKESHPTGDSTVSADQQRQASVAPDSANKTPGKEDPAEKYDDHHGIAHSDSNDKDLLK